MIATAAGDGNIVVWSLDTGELLQVLSGHSVQIYFILFILFLDLFLWIL